MRASFILTHRPGKKFHFMDYILASMDDDCAKVICFDVKPWSTCVCPSPSWHIRPAASSLLGIAVCLASCFFILLTC